MLCWHLQGDASILEASFINSQVTQQLHFHLRHRRSIGPFDGQDLRQQAAAETLAGDLKRLHLLTDARRWVVP